MAREQHNVAARRNSVAHQRNGLAGRRFDMAERGEGLHRSGMAPNANARRRNSSVLPRWGIDTRRLATELRIRGKRRKCTAPTSRGNVSCELHRRSYDLNRIGKGRLRKDTELPKMAARSIGKAWFGTEKAQHSNEQQAERRIGVDTPRNATEGS